MRFFGDAGDVALLEVASPVGDNSGLHMLFFDPAHVEPAANLRDLPCSRGQAIF